MTILNDCEKAKYEMSYHVEDSKLDILEAEMKDDNNNRVTANAAWLTAEKRLVRKLNFTLVPMLRPFYLFNYLDRNNIAFRAVAPAQLLVPTKGICLAYHHILLRCPLGDCIFWPHRGWCFAGLKGVNGLAGRKWLFIIEGAGSFAAALLVLFLLPDFPSQKSGVVRWLLSDEEQKLAVERIGRDRVSQPTEDFSASTIILTADHSAYGFNNFFPTIVKGMKLGNDTNTLLMTAPPHLVANLVALATASSSDRREERGYHISIPQDMVCIGFIVTLATTNNEARYAVAFQERVCTRAIIAQPVGQYLQPVLFPLVPTGRVL
ncbi:major facilitator superfamily transporter [Seiridium cupressi]